MNQEKIGKFIAELRHEKNLTQEELAVLLGVNNRTISRWENGYCMPDLSLLAPLSECLGISLNELLSGERIQNNDLIVESNNNLKNILSLTNNERKTKNKLKILSIWLIVFIILIISGFTAYNIYNSVKEEQFLKFQEQKLELLTPKQNIDLYKKYKNKSMNNITNTGELLLSLPLSDIGFNYDIDDDNKILKIEYKLAIGAINNLKDDYNFAQKSIVYNSAVLFLLIDDIDSIEYNFDAGFYDSDQLYKFDKTNFLEIFTIANIEMLNDNENWKKMILNIINDDVLFNDKWNLLNN